MRHRAILFLWLTLLLASLACGLTNPGGLPTAAPTPTVGARSGGDLAGAAAATVTANTSSLPSPEPTLTAFPEPSPTIDPNLADWTILVYMAADNDLELQSLLDINEMEAAGQSDEVNVLLQVDRTPGETALDGDWTTTRRYQVTGDKDPDNISAALLQDLGELNMGDPDVLTDFLVWGMTDFPANHYALVLWDHGAGWLGIAFDDSVSGYDELSMNDLAGALQRALAQTGRQRLDIIGFDACLMGQMEVYGVISPYADYAVGSEELVPDLGWDYASLLADLYAAPQMEAAQLAERMVNHYAAYYRDVAPDEFVTMSAVRLAEMPAINAAVEALAAVLMREPAVAASAVADARAGAESFARYFPEDADYYAAVDLWHFAGILAQRSADEQVVDAARQVMTAVEEAVIAEQHGGAFQYTGGIAVYFPRLREFMEPAYGSQSPAAGWNRFLNTYHDAGLAQVREPTFNVVNVLSDTVGYQQPAYMEVEITGRDIEYVYLIAGSYEPDGRLRLVEYDYLIPEPTYLPDGAPLYQWRDGVHEDFFIWYTDAAFVTDGQNGDYAVMWPTGYDSSLYVVAGRYRRADDTAYLDANLVFDTDTGELDSVWGVQGSDAGAPYQIAPAAGDEFQLYRHYLQPDGSALPEAGVSLFFAGSAAISYQWRPLPSGNYSLSFAAETIAGQWVETSQNFTVNNDNLRPGYAAYLDPYQGFQFNYPAGWHRPEYDGTLLSSRNISETTWLTILLYPNLTDGTAETLKAQTLTDFGAVDILYEDAIAVAGGEGLITAYGYETEDGAIHTGVFFTFVHDNTGYVVDIDGPLAEEEFNLAAAIELIDSWAFQPAYFGLYPGNWSTLSTDDFTIARPLTFDHEPLDNGWQLFTGEDSDTFIALRADPDSGSGREAVLTNWVRVASEGVASFISADPYRYALADNVWLRRDFEYIADDGALMRGFILVTLRQGREIVAWAEAPAAAFPDLENQTFLPLISGLALP